MQLNCILHVISVPKQLAEGALIGMRRTKGAPISMMDWHKEQGRRISGMIWTTVFFNLLASPVDRVLGPLPGNEDEVLCMTHG